MENLFIQNFKNELKANQVSTQKPKEKTIIPESKSDSVELGSKSKNKKKRKTAFVLGSIAIIGGIAGRNIHQYLKINKIFKNARKLMQESEEKLVETVKDILTNKKNHDIIKIQFLEKELPQFSRKMTDEQKAGELAFEVIKSISKMKNTGFVGFTMKSPKFNILANYTQRLISNPHFNEITKTSSTKLINGIPESTVKKLELLKNVRSLFDNKLSGPIEIQTYNFILSQELLIMQKLIKIGGKKYINKYIDVLEQALLQVTKPNQKLDIMEKIINAGKKDYVNKFTKLATETLAKTKDPIKKMETMGKLLKVDKISYINDYLKLIDKNLSNINNEREKLILMSKHIRPVSLALEDKFNKTGKGHYKIIVEKINNTCEKYIKTQKIKTPTGTKMSVQEALRVLNIDDKINKDTLNKAYRKKAMKHHPDKVANLSQAEQNAAKEEFQKINEANETLKKHFGIK